jgi:hypothetical protein
MAVRLSRHITFSRRSERVFTTTTFLVQDYNRLHFSFRKFCQSNKKEAQENTPTRENFGIFSFLLETPQSTQNMAKRVHDETSPVVEVNAKKDCIDLRRRKKLLKVRIKQPQLF